MKALTVRQPWAMLIALGIKQFETRSWATSHRGPLAIHSSARCSRKLLEELARDPQYNQVLSHFPALPLGCVIATVDLVDCIRITEGSAVAVLPQERAFGDYTPGRFAWKLVNVAKLPPFKAKGHLGLWDWEPSA